MTARDLIVSPLNSIKINLSSLLVAVFFALISHYSGADPLADEIILLDSASSKIPITPGAEYILFDRTVSLEEVISASNDSRWQNYEGQGINSNHGLNQELWLRFTAKPSWQNQSPWWLVINWPLLEHAQLAVLKHNTQEWQYSKPIGLNYPLTNRPIYSRYLIFPQTFNNQEPQTYYLSLRSSSLLSVPIDFWQAEDFETYKIIDTLIFGAFLGALIIMLLYNLSLWLMLKDSTYGYYCLYVATVVVYQLATSGIGAYYLWPNSLWIANNIMFLASTTCFVAATIFVRHFLRLYEYGGWLLWGNNLLLFMWATVIFSGFVVGPPSMVPIINICSFFSCIVATVTGAVLWKKNVPSAKIFVISWSILILSTIIFVLGLQGALPFNFITRYSQVVGFVTELVLLSAALAYRINREITERELAQSEALMLTKKVSEERRERLKAQMETLAIQRKLNEDLETHVVERTEQLNEAMEKLENANAELTKLSVTDPLTKVHNRRYFDDTLIDEYKRALRSKHTLAVIVVDIDHFKSINDNYGHVVGDTCISLVAQTLKTVINRPGDLVARYGGEEFVYILPGSDEKDALIVANNCREEIEKLDFKINGYRIPLTVSAGVAAWIPTEEGAYKQLINAADTALYRAKNGGRNCVKTASDRGKLAQI